MADKEATTMSVMDMGRLLGLKKTDSYYLLHKNWFDTVRVAGKTRVVKASFESWYATQDRYRKVNGPPPGEKLREQMYSVQDIADMLALSKDSVLELIHREGFLTLVVGGKFRIPKMIFDAWYASQGRYQNTEAREHDLPALKSSMTVPEMGRLMGLDPRRAWNLYYSERDALEMIRIAERPRITMVSFQNWYVQQDRYQLVPPEAMPGRSPWNTTMSATEAADRLQVDPHRIYRLITNGEIHGKRLGGTWYVCYYEALYGLLRRE